MNFSELLAGACNPFLPTPAQPIVMNRVYGSGCGVQGVGFRV